VEQLAHQVLVGLPIGYIQTEAAHAFIDGVRDREVKQHLLMGSDRTLNEALNQALKLEAAKAAAWPTARLWEVTRVPTGRPCTPPERRRKTPPRLTLKVLAKWAKGSLTADGWIQEKPC
jgi:hypothetical protein